MENSNMGWYVIGGVVVGVIVVIRAINSLIAQKNQVAYAFACMEAMLKRRWSLVPAMLHVAQTYMAHEKALLTELTALRTSRPSDHTAKWVEEANRKLSGAFGQFQAVAENYPLLRANENILAVQQAIFDAEDQIGAARRFYNAAVTQYNNSIEMVPWNFLASMMGYKTKPCFQIQAHEREDLKLSGL